MRNLLFIALLLLSSCTFGQPEKLVVIIPDDFTEHKYHIEGTNQTVVFIEKATPVEVRPGIVIVTAVDRVYMIVEHSPTNRDIICSGTYKFDYPSLTLEWRELPWEYLHINRIEEGRYRMVCKETEDEQIWEQIE